MSARLKVLMVEDWPADVELAVRELRAARLDPEWRTVDSEEGYVASLDPAPDLILADYNLPQFSAPRALALLQERGLDIPFIVLSGTISDEAALECMRQGASDYLLKDRLARLGPAVIRALEARGHRQAHQRAMEELRESEERFRSIFEHSAIGMVVQELDGRYIRVNPAFCQMVGYSEQELLALRYQTLTHPDDVGADVERDRQMLAGEIPSYQTEKRFVGKYGRVLWALMSVSLVRGRDGSPVCFVAQLQDITARKELEERLRQSQKMEAIGQLAGGVAHDFNNLLTVVLGRAQMLLHQAGGDARVRRNIELIEQTAERAAALTQQLLAFSRRQILQSQVVDMNPIIVGVERMLRRIIGERIEVILRLTPDTGRVKVDPGQLEQVILNLVVNARDAMPRGGQLILETADAELDASYAAQHLGSQSGRYVMLAVSDTGIGMDAEVQARIFEPFFTTKESGKGTGLGLATVYGIVKQSGGNIWVYSEPGHGTTFRVYLPRVDEPAMPTVPAPVVTAVPRGSESILLAEDEDGLRHLVRETLEGLGYTVIEVGHGGQALVLAGQHAGRLDLLLTDVIMPHISGPELADRLAPLHPETRVLYMSGYTGEVIRYNEPLGPGLFLLQKPFTPDMLARKVREVLDHPGPE